MSKRSGERKRGDDVCATVVKSGLTGVAATFLMAAVSSPAGLGGMIGVAEGRNVDQASAEALNLPAMTRPLSTSEIATIERRLQHSSAEMDAMRLATDAEIQLMREIADQAGSLGGLD